MLTPTGKSVAGTSGKVLPHATVSSCSGCGKIVTEETQALQCDKCMSNESWKCAECLNLTAEAYDCLLLGTVGSIRWFCEDCDKKVMDSKHVSEGQSDKIDHLIGVIEKLVSHYEDIERKLDSKSSVEDVSKLESRITRLEKRMQKQDMDIDSKLNSFEDQLKATAEMDCVEKDQGISDEDVIKCVVQEELRKSAEEQDIEKRKRNIILYRVPEKKIENVSERKANDLEFIKDFLDGVFNQAVEDRDIVNSYRLGRWSEDKVRPLLVTFSNVDMKDNIMANLKNLRTAVDKFKGIGVSHDLHPKEREENKAMIEEAKREHSANTGEQTENYRFLVVGRGQKKKVITIKRKNMEN